MPRAVKRGPRAGLCLLLCHPSDPPVCGDVLLYVLFFAGRNGSFCVLCEVFYEKCMEPAPSLSLRWKLCMRVLFFFWLTIIILLQSILLILKCKKPTAGRHCEQHGDQSAVDWKPAEDVMQDGNGGPCATGNVRHAPCSRCPVRLGIGVVTGLAKSCKTWVPPLFRRTSNTV